MEDIIFQIQQLLVDGYSQQQIEEYGYPNTIIQEQKVLLDVTGLLLIEQTTQVAQLDLLF